MSVHGKTLLLIGAGPEMVPAIAAAHALGVYVVVTDRNPTAPGFAHADAHALVSTRDVQGTVAAAREMNLGRRIDGVMTLASDVPLTVSSVAHALGLPGLPVEVAATCQDKLAMKRRLRAGAVPIPNFASADCFDEARRIAPEIGYPLIIKPLDNSGARGVSRVSTPASLEAAWIWALAHRVADSGPLLLEEALQGPQISTETIIATDRPVTTGFADRNYERVESFAPYIIEDGHTVPSFLNDDERAEVTRVAELAMQALGISFGVAKGDLVLTAQGARVIEMAARLSGGRFATDTVPLATGVDAISAMIRLSLGDHVQSRELAPSRNRAAAQRYIFPAPGVVASIRGVEEAKAAAGVTRVELYIGEGDLIVPVTNHAQRAGYVIAEAASRAEAITRAEAARALISVETRA